MVSLVYTEVWVVVDQAWDLVCPASPRPLSLPDCLWHPVIPPGCVGWLELYHLIFAPPGPSPGHKIKQILSAGSLKSGMNLNLGLLWENQHLPE